MKYNHAQTAQCSGFRDTGELSSSSRKVIASSDYESVCSTVILTTFSSYKGEEPSSSNKGKSQVCDYC